MEFEALNASELTAYLRGIPAVHALLGEPAELDIAEVGDGNLNYVYFASNAGAAEKSVVVKQAPPFLRLVGKTWPLGRERMEREVAALRRFGSLCPQHVPKVYHADSQLFLMVMQRLASHRILRQGLTDGVVYPRLADHLSTYLANTLFFGSDLFLNADIKKQAMSAAVNSELCGITEDLVFTYPFEDHPSNVYSAKLPRAALERLRQTPALRVAAAEMKWAFMNHAETLLHGDLHTGSIMVNADETYVIDPEFSFYRSHGVRHWRGARQSSAGLFLARLARPASRRAAGSLSGVAAGTGQHDLVGVRRQVPEAMAGTRRPQQDFVHW